MEKLRLFGGNSNPMLVSDIARSLGIEVSKAKISRFSDGEPNVKILANVRKMDVFAVQSFCKSGDLSVNDTFMEFQVMIDALKRASAGSITAVIPYFGYARQDRKKDPRTPITAKLVADIITVAGANRVLTVDLHAGQIQGFFNIPVDNLYGSLVFLPNLKKEYSNNLVVVSPDAGGTDRARAFATRLNAGLAIIDKRRDESGKVVSMRIVGEVEGKIAMLLDDMVDTAGTTCEAGEVVKGAGAISVFVCATHAVLSGPAIERLENSCLEEIMVTNTIPLADKAKANKKIRQVPIDSLLAEAIRRIHQGDSISALFN
jgi:ribose-phosphate pyrophosphokinase